ncbi:MAG: hypothetical protein ABL940_04370 [Bacteroidia bacterium]
MKLLQLIINLIAWTTLFASPMLLFTSIGVAFFYKTNLVFESKIIVLLGALMGITFAGYIRKKYGCVNFISRIRKF